MREALRPLKACASCFMTVHAVHIAETDWTCTHAAWHDLAACPVQVSALVFYGRKRYARILNVYLDRNLARNGGVLHEVFPFSTSVFHALPAARCSSCRASTGCCLPAHLLRAPACSAHAAPPAVTSCTVVLQA